MGRKKYLHNNNNINNNNKNIDKTKKKLTKLKKKTILWQNSRTQTVTKLKKKNCD